MIRAQPSRNKAGQEIQHGKLPELQARSSLPEATGTPYNPALKQDCASSCLEAPEMHWLLRSCGKHALAVGFICLLSCSAKLL